MIPVDDLSLSLHGRRRIVCRYDHIDETNIETALSEALAIHSVNVAEQKYLWDYRRNITPILSRVKEIRSEINNKVCVGLADMIVEFKNGYFMTSPAFYTARRDGSDAVIDKINTLNEYLYTSGKHEADKTVIDWFHTVGRGVLFAEPNRRVEEWDWKPMSVYPLHPNSGFVVYSPLPGNEPLMGVNAVKVDGVLRYDVFTEDRVYRMSSTPPHIDEVLRNEIGEIPIVEYWYNTTGMGSFEKAITALDGVNKIQSNRLDGIDQFIQSLIVTTNVRLPDGMTADDIRKAGMINLPSDGGAKADFKVLSEQLDQGQTETALDSLVNEIMDTCGVPFNMRSDYSTSDNVGAVYLRNGWATADTHARNTTDLYRQSNRYYERVQAAILKMTNGFRIDPLDCELVVPRNDLTNLLAKAQAASTMKDLGLAPEIWLERSGLSNDPLKDIKLSADWLEHSRKEQEELDAEAMKQQQQGGGEGNKPDVSSDNWVNGYFRK